MNTKEFKALETELKSNVIYSVVNEILDTIEQGGITKVSEIKPEVDLLIKELFGNTKKIALIREIMAELDKNISLVITNK